eukprot:Amastigsp_a177846_15.p3 type:complete len:154 gc:universal Amastigsp_a177846_15:1721-1260(-)
MAHATKSPASKILHAAQIHFAQGLSERFGERFRTLIELLEQVLVEVALCGAVLEIERRGESVRNGLSAVDKCRCSLGNEAPVKMRALGMPTSIRRNAPLDGLAERDLALARLHVRLEPATVEKDLFDVLPRRGLGGPRPTVRQPGLASLVELH